MQLFNQSKYFRYHYLNTDIAFRMLC